MNCQPGCGLAVVRYLDGRTIKGRTFDFSPRKPSFRVFVGDRSSAPPPLAVRVDGLKAIFFVRSLDGLGQDDDYIFTRPHSNERRAVVMFKDREMIPGTVIDHDAESPGFFLIPAQENGNNCRVYVPRSAVRKIRWL